MKKITLVVLGIIAVCFLIGFYMMKSGNDAVDEYYNKPCPAKEYLHLDKK